jgi:hypothetical protein
MDKQGNEIFLFYGFQTNAVSIADYAGKGVKGSSHDLI